MDEKNYLHHRTPKTRRLSMRTDLNQTQLITAKELTAISGVSPRTIYRWHQAHQLPGIKISRSLFFPKYKTLEMLLAHGVNHYNQGCLDEET